MSMTEISKQLTLKVPRKAIYRFLGENDLCARMNDFVSDITVQPLLVASQDLGQGGGELESIIARITKMAKANPWAGKECNEIVKSLRILHEGTKEGPRVAGEVMNPQFFKTRVMEEVPESHVVIEVGAGRTGVRCEADLVEHGETTDVQLKVKGTEASSAETHSALFAIVRDLVSFEQGYLARMRMEYFERS